MKTVASVILMIAVFVFGDAAAVRRADAQEAGRVDDVLTVIHRRKSVRKYLDKPVEREQLITLLKAGMAAPSAADRRPWAFVVVTDKALLDSLATVSPSSKMLANAAAAIVVCGDTRRALNSNVWTQDCSAATQNILLAAEGIGLGAVWCGIYPEYFKYNHIRRIFDIPMEVIPLSLISIGWPTGEEKPKEKYDPSNIHWNAW